MAFQHAIFHPVSGRNGIHHFRNFATPTASPRKAVHALHCRWTERIKAAPPAVGKYCDNWRISDPQACDPCRDNRGHIGCELADYEGIFAAASRRQPFLLFLLYLLGMLLVTLALPFFCLAYLMAWIFDARPVHPAMILLIYVSWMLPTLAIMLWNSRRYKNPYAP